MNEVDMKTGDHGKVLVPTAPQAAASTAASRATPDDRGSFGRALAAARDARGLSQADVAAQLRLHLRQVQAIEAEDLEALPEGPFVRGYIRNYAKLVDLPAEPLLALLGTRLRPTDPLHAQADSRSVSPIQRTPGEPRSGRYVVAGIVLALIILGAFGWWSMRADEAKPVATPAPTAPPQSTTPLQSAAPPPAATVPTEAAASAASSAAPADAAAIVAAAPAVEAATAPVQAGPASIGSPLRLSFRDRSWVEVRQADGTVLMSQNNAPGTSRTVEGTPPYLIVIGNASKVDLEFRGQAVDLAGYISRDDIARLRLE